MYTAPQLRIDDWEIVSAIIRRYPFVSLIGLIDGRPTITKTPVILHGRTVSFHLAKRNELADVIAAGGAITMLVDGPNRYISPTVYATVPEVPTWNYVVIQCELQARIVNDRAWILQHHDELVAAFERDGWRNELPERYRDGLHAMLVGVSAEVTSFAAKFKLGQEYPVADFRGVYRALLARDPHDELARIMREVYGERLHDAT